MLHLSKKMRFLPYILILPAFLLICIFKLYPIITTLIESFFVDSKFTFGTYTALFEDKSFWNSLWITVKANIIMIPLQIFLAFVVALLVNSSIRGVGAFRTIFYLPVTISITIACLVWNIMLNPDSGVVNSIFRFVGIPAQDFFISKTQALWCIVLVATWKGVGYWMMFILAGLKNIDTAIYESAKIDGAGYIKTITSITLPLIKKVLLFVFVANTTANILLFVPMQVITNGGPQESTNVLMFEAYRSAFKYGDRARSSAIVMILLLLIIAICLVQAGLLSEKEDNGKRRRRR